MNAAPLRQRNFALLWFAGLISVAGDWMLRIAIPIHVLKMTGSVAAISGVVTATVAPVLLFGLIAGVYVDRWDRRKVMFVTSLAQGLVLLPLLAVESTSQLWIVYLVAFAGSTLSQFFASAENALLPNVVPAEQLPAANSLNALNNNLGRLIGPALGGVAAATLSLGGVALADTLTFLVAAGLIALVKGRYQVNQERKGVLRELGGGIRIIGGNRDRRRVCRALRSGQRADRPGPGIRNRGRRLLAVESLVPPQPTRTRHRRRRQPTRVMR